LLSEQWGPESPRLIVPYDALGKLYRSQLGREAEVTRERETGREEEREGERGGGGGS